MSMDYPSLATFAQAADYLAQRLGVAAYVKTARHYSDFSQ